MPKRIDIPHQFLCRPYQVEAWEALRAGKKRVVCAWHRGAGKDLFALNYLIYKAVQEPGVYLHCFPKYSQGKRAIWNSVHNTHTGESLGYLDHFPKELIKNKNSTEMRIELTTGSIYCVLGLDGKNATQARGMNPCFVILSEYAYMDPESWYTIEPRISQNHGQALFLSTPNGQNHFYDLYNYAKSGNSNEHYASLLTIGDTAVLDNAHIDRLRGEGIPEDFIQQEYFCSFTRGAEGSYYGKYIQDARDQDRITWLPIVPDLPVFTAWDIGIGDANAIWIFQPLQNGKINCLHYVEESGRSLGQHIQYLENWKSRYKVIWGRHFVPHDMANKEYTSGLQRIDAARNLGYEMTLVPRLRIDEGIQAVRETLPLCNFHDKECARGIKCLDFYRKKWNDSGKVYYDEPFHDQWSHGADAFRMLATGLKKFGASPIGKLTGDSIKEMRMRNMGY